MKYIEPVGVIGAANGYGHDYVDKNAGAGQAGSFVAADAIEHPMLELVGLVAKSGQTPSETDLQQVARAIRSQALNYIATAGGTANARTVTLDPAPTSYAELLPGRLIIGIPATNTGSATLNINTLGALPIIRNDDGSALAGGELPPFAEFWIIGGNARLLNPLAASVNGVGGYQNVVGTVNVALTLNNVAVAVPWASTASASVFGTISGSVFTFTKAGRYTITGRMQISVTGTPTGQFAACLGSIVKNNGTGSQIVVCNFGDDKTLIGSVAVTSYITGSGAIDAVPGDTLILTGLESISSGGTFTSGNIATASMTILRTQ